METIRDSKNPRTFEKMRVHHASISKALWISTGFHNQRKHRSIPDNLVLCRIFFYGVTELPQAYITMQCWWKIS